MDELKFTTKDPQKGYVTQQLLVPKRALNQQATREALTFCIGDEEIFDPELGLIGVRAKEVHLWDETAHHMVVPKEYLNKLSRERLARIHKFEWVNEEYPTEQLVLPDNIELRDETQIAALRAMKQHRCGTVHLACGAGKTIIALKYWVQIARPALVVVNSGSLADQWMRKIRKFISEDIKIGLVQGTGHEWRDCQIVLATVQTLANRRDEWPMEFRRYFGVIFFDEGHHMAAPHFVKAADLFFGQRFSLTATAFRTDGLEAISMHHIGDIIYQDLSQDLIPLTVFHRLKWQATEEQSKFSRDDSGKVHPKRFAIMLGRFARRNAVIMKHLKKDLEAGRQVLLLSHSVKHTRRLETLARKFWKTVGIINGEDVDPYDRIPILESCNPVIGTFDLAREALDKDVLDTLYICTPLGNANDLQQSIGRIQREKDGKENAIVRVFEDVIRGDKKLNMGVDQCRRTKLFLRAQKYPLREEEEQL